MTKMVIGNNALILCKLITTPLHGQIFPSIIYKLKEKLIMEPGSHFEGKEPEFNSFSAKSRLASPDVKSSQDLRNEEKTRKKLLEEIEKRNKQKLIDNSDKVPELPVPDGTPAGGGKKRKPAPGAK